jgi:hypothetical protein
MESAVPAFAIAQLLTSRGFDRSSTLPDRYQPKFLLAVVTPVEESTSFKSTVPYAGTETLDPPNVTFHCAASNVSLETRMFSRVVLLCLNSQPPLISPVLVQPALGGHSTLALASPEH